MHAVSQNELFIHYDGIWLLRKYLKSEKQIASLRIGLTEIERKENNKQTLDTFQVIPTHILKMVDNKLMSVSKYI